MNVRNKLFWLLWVVLQCSVVPVSCAPSYPGNVYQDKVEIIEGLSFYNMSNYDTLYHLEIVDTSSGQVYRWQYYGWIDKKESGDIDFIHVHGVAQKINKNQIGFIKQLPLNDATMAHLLQMNKSFSDGWMEHFGKNYLLLLWLHKKGESGYAQQLFPLKDTFFSRDYIRDDFGIIYYNAMLHAYTVERNYAKAIAFGNHLAKDAFIKYRYQKESIILTKLLKADSGDATAVQLPDSLAWEGLKQTLGRPDRIRFLAGRLRLLNCIQPGQPAGINYRMHQFSISADSSFRLGFGYWEYNKQYMVINPYSELLLMKLDTREMTLLLPYLLDETPIPHLYLFQGFFPQQNLA